MSLLDVSQIMERGVERLHRRARTIRRKWQRRKVTPCDLWHWCCQSAGHPGECLHPRDVKHLRATR